MTIVEGVDVFLNVVSNYRCARVFKLLVYLGARARTAVLFRFLRGRNFSLLEGPSYFNTTSIYRVAIGFSFILSRGFKGGR